MSEHLANRAVRRRQRVCDASAGAQEASWPRRARQAARARVQATSNFSYLALDGGGGSHSLELAILKLVIGSFQNGSHYLPVSALRAAFEPIRLADFLAALARLEKRRIFNRDGDLIGLTRPVRRLVDLGLIPSV